MDTPTAEEEEEGMDEVSFSTDAPDAGQTVGTGKKREVDPAVKSFLGSWAQRQAWSLLRCEDVGLLESEAETVIEEEMAWAGMGPGPDPETLVLAQSGRQQKADQGEIGPSARG